MFRIIEKLKSFFFLEDKPSLKDATFDNDCGDSGLPLSNYTPPMPKVKLHRPPSSLHRPPSPPPGRRSPRFKPSPNYQPVQQTTEDDNSSLGVFLATSLVLDALSQPSNSQPDESVFIGGDGNFGGAGASGTWDAPTDQPTEPDSMPSEVPDVPDIEPDPIPTDDSSNSGDSSYDSSDSGSSDSGSSDSGS